MKRFNILLFGVLLYACAPTENKLSNTMTVSIEPLRYLTDQITEGDFDIHVLVPPGSSPETYEPTPTQMKQVTHSLAYIDIGLIDFEQNLAKSIQQNMPDVLVIHTAEQVSLLGGTCGHASHNHQHGVDPHIWLSPKCLKIMAKNIYDGVSTLYPDSSKYKEGYNQLDQRIDSLDRALQTIFKGDSTSFMIFHPALTYLANDYGLQQIALENEGKEPTATHLRNLITQARTLGIDKVLYQKQLSSSTVDALAKELNIEPVVIDPLSSDVPNNLLVISRLIAN